MRKIYIMLFTAGLIIAVNTNLLGQDPFAVRSDLFDQSDENTLGLTIPEGVETITVFAPTSETDKFSNGVVMIGFNDSIYCQWQSSASSEDTQDTWIAYSASKDGKTWTAPRVLAPSIANGYSSSGGWWVNGDSLIAYINTWPADLAIRGGYTRYISTANGVEWTEPRVVRMQNGDTLKGIFEQDPHLLPSGRIVNAAHFQPGIYVNPIYTDDPYGVRGWVKAEYTNLPSAAEYSKEIEPSTYYRKDGAVVMIFRDQEGSLRKYASISMDNAVTWSPVALTTMPDGRTKQSAGNIGDSLSYFAGSPIDKKTRMPLALTLSGDGKYFNTAYLLRSKDNIQAQRYTGGSKSAGYHYTKSMVWKDTLYVSYATNKEDVDYTRVPVKSLQLDNSAGTVPFIQASETLKEISATQEIFSLTISSNIIWNATEESSWISISKTNSATLLIGCNANSATEERVDTVTLNGAFVDPQKIVVKQAGKVVSADLLENNELTLIVNKDKTLELVQDQYETGAAVSIYNMYGQQVYQGDLTGNDMFIDLSGNVTGTYIIQVSSGQTRTIQKFILH